ncbi:MAG: glutamate 5-kinase [Saprospiraceae bacterium]
MQNRFKTLVIKVGTNVLTREDGLLDLTTISHLVDQIAALKQTGTRVILVSSGAVGAGRSLVQVPATWSKITQRQVLSAVGQVKLLNTYLQFFANYQMFCAQVLATKEDFRGRQHYLNMRECFQALLQDNIIPIVNENDVISVSELMFTDNDELAGLVAAMLNADGLIILSNIDGVYDGPPANPASKVIPQIDCDDKKILEVIAPSKSSFGRGGMQTKLRIAQKAAKVGIDTFIANGKRQNTLLAINNNDYIGTIFPAKTQVSNVKKWIAYNDLQRKGEVKINAGAERALCTAEKITSLLPIGITATTGEFKKGDLIKVINENGEQIGVGIAQYGAEKAREYLGQNGKKALIHYDYLFIEK